MIELGFISSPRDVDVTPRSGDFHHGGNLLSNRHEWPALEAPINSRLLGAGRAQASGEIGNAPPPAIHSAMARVMARYLLDGFYIIAFFAIMSAVALGANWIVIECEQSNIDPFVLLVLKGVSYMLVILDAAGVVTVTGLLTYSLIRMTMKAGDLDA